MEVIGIHSPTPWRNAWSKKSPSINLFGANDYPIGRVPVHLCVGDNDEANVEFLIRAVNAHDDLLEACKRLVQMFSGVLGESTVESQILAMGTAAITKATQEVIQ